MHLPIRQVHANIAHMAQEVSPAAARAALLSASTTSERVRAHARWMGTYLAVFAAGFGILTLLFGLVSPLQLRMTLFGVGWPLLMLSMVWWAGRRPASLRGTSRRVAKYWVGTTFLYGVVLLVGTPRLVGDARYWVPAAALVAAPMFLGALREHRT